MTETDTARTLSDSMAYQYGYGLDRVISRFRDLTERLERVGKPTSRAISKNRTPYSSAAAEVVTEIRNTIGNLNLEGLIVNAAETDLALAEERGDGIVTIGGQRYAVTTEDHRGDGSINACLVPVEQEG